LDRVLLSYSLLSYSIAKAICLKEAFESPLANKAP
jgi:hypothetical protein